MDDKAQTSRKQAIIQELPYLRRYARALSGSQEIGDRHVRECLERLLTAPERLAHSADLRVQLFATFHGFLGDIRESARSAPKFSNSAARIVQERLEQKVLTLSPPHRQVLLLTQTEGFSIPDVAKILRIDEATVARRLAKAWNELGHQPKTDVLVIEDEPIIAFEIASIVKEMGHRVTAIASQSDQAVSMAEAHTPGLVLADIRLRGGTSGINAVSKILQGADVPVVFVTAFPEEFLTGEKLEPAFLVTKPFERGTLKVAISQALFCGPPTTMARQGVA